jgi:hypothetical protein
VSGFPPQADQQELVEKLKNYGIEGFRDPIADFRIQISDFGLQGKDCGLRDVDLVRPRPRHHIE